MDKLSPSSLSGIRKFYSQVQLGKMKSEMDWGPKSTLKAFVDSPVLVADSSSLPGSEGASISL